MTKSKDTTIERGKLYVMPTDTVYGVVCRADDPEAVMRLYRLKKRSKKPGTIVAADAEQLVKLGIKRRYLKPVEYLWPGAVSVIVPSEPSLKYLDQGAGSLAVRIPEQVELLQLLQSSGPLLTTSANQPGDPPANTISEAKKYFGDQVDEYIDGGNLEDRKPSTLVRVVDDVVEILREGAVKMNEKGEIEK